MIAAAVSGTGGSSSCIGGNAKEIGPVGNPLVTLPCVLSKSTTSGVVVPSSPASPPAAAGSATALGSLPSAIALAIRAASSEASCSTGFEELALYISGSSMIWAERGKSRWPPFANSMITPPSAEVIIVSLANTLSPTCRTRSAPLASTALTKPTTVLTVPTEVNCVPEVTAFTVLAFSIAMMNSL